MPVTRSPTQKRKSFNYFAMQELFVITTPEIFNPILQEYFWFRCAEGNQLKTALSSFVCYIRYFNFYANLKAKNLYYILGLELVTIYSNPSNVYYQKFRPENIIFTDTQNISSWQSPPVGNLSSFMLYRR